MLQIPWFRSVNLAMDGPTARRWQSLCGGWAEARELVGVCRSGDPKRMRVAVREKPSKSAKESAARKCSCDDGIGDCDFSRIRWRV